LTGHALSEMSIPMHPPNPDRALMPHYKIYLKWYSLPHMKIYPKAWIFLLEAVASSMSFS